MTRWELVDLLFSVKRFRIEGIKNRGLDSGQLLLSMRFSGHSNIAVGVHSKVL